MVAKPFVAVIECGLQVELLKVARRRVIAVMPAESPTLP